MTWKLQKIVLALYLQKSEPALEWEEKLFSDKGECAPLETISYWSKCTSVTQETIEEIMNDNPILVEWLQLCGRKELNKNEMYNSLLLNQLLQESNKNQD